MGLSVCGGLDHNGCFKRALEPHSLRKGKSVCVSHTDLCEEGGESKFSEGGGGVVCILLTKCF